MRAKRDSRRGLATAALQPRAGSACYLACLFLPGALLGRTRGMMRNSARSLRLVAIAITVAISLAYLALPVYETSAGRETVIESNGLWVLVLLLFPAAIVLLPYTVSEGRRRAAEGWAAALLTMFALITGF